jgi:hypothetical protein
MEKKSDQGSGVCLNSECMSSLQFLNSKDRHFAKLRRTEGFTTVNVNSIIQLCPTFTHFCEINKTSANLIKAFEYPCTILCRGREKHEQPFIF